MELHSDEALYLYCFAKTPFAGDVEGKGIDGSSPLIPHSFRDITAVVSRLSLEELGGVEKVDDPAWISPRAARHAGVIERVAERSPVLPVRFGMLFSSLERLESLMADRYTVILDYLERVAGMEEWSLKAFLDRRKARNAAAHDAETETMPPKGPPPASAGTAGEGGGLEGDLAGWLDARKREVGDALRGGVRDLLERAVLPGDPSPRGEELLWNYALLVPRANREVLGRVVDTVGRGLESAGISLRFSGPWPPHSFAPSLAVED